jgi:hypothetical protein
VGQGDRRRDSRLEISVGARPGITAKTTTWLGAVLAVNTAGEENGPGWYGAKIMNCLLLILAERDINDMQFLGGRGLLDAFPVALRPLNPGSTAPGESGPTSAGT